MKIKSIAIKSLFIVLFLISIIISLLASFSLIGFVLNPSDKYSLRFCLSALIACSVFWGGTFFVGNLDKNKSKKEKVKELKEILVKMPLILASSVITSIYVLIYFFFFGFVMVSEYKKDGGWWGDGSGQTMFLTFLAIGITIFSLVMYRVFKTEKADITLTLYNQFTVLKWSSLIALFFGGWSTYYFYHTEGIGGWVLIFIWDVILYAFYKVFDKLSNKAQNSITDTNINRIIHEKKKSILNNNSPISNTSNSNKIDSHSIADELKKFKELLDQGVITQEEFDTQKKRLIQM